MKGPAEACLGDGRPLLTTRVSMEEVVDFSRAPPKCSQGDSSGQFYGANHKLAERRRQRDTIRVNRSPPSSSVAFWTPLGPGVGRGGGPGAPFAIRRGEGAQMKRCRDRQCSPRGYPACWGTFGGRRKAVRDRFAFRALSGTVSPFRAEQGTSLETPSRARASSCHPVTP